ncbi:MAG: ribosome-binding factor A [Planctomycetaceae bacterium]
MSSRRSKKRSEPRERRADRKTLQLCRQVQRTLSYVLGECDDSVVQACFVEAVEPAPDASRLLVTVSSMDKDKTPITVIEHLSRSAGFLRSEIAASISRRKVPELAFRCIAPEPPA